MTPKRTRCVIYARVSPSPREFDKSADSIETQMEMCTQYAESENFIIKGKYCDQGISGSEEERPGLWDAIKRLTTGNVLIVYKLDRLARGVFLSHSLEKLVTKAGATIRSVKGEGTWSDTSEDRMMRNMLRTFDEYFRGVNNRRISDSMRSHQRNGRIMCDPKRLPYGYELNDLEKRTMRKNTQEMDIVEIIRDKLEEGASAFRVAKKLNAAGVPARTGVWTGHKIYQIIRVHDLAYPYSPDKGEKLTRRAD